MLLSRRQRAQRAAYRWLLLGLAGLVAVAAVFPVGALVAAGGPMTRFLTSGNCRAILRQGVPLLGVHLDGGQVPRTREPQDGAGQGGVVAWLFGALTGVSPGRPVSFLMADLPLARTSYADAIVASGRHSRAAGDSPAAGSAGGLPSGAGPGGGLSPGNPGHSASPPTSRAETGVPPEGLLDDETAQLYLYGGPKPLVAIVHTHGSESFLPVLAAMARAKDPGADVAALDAFTEDSSVNMLRVGEELARYLATTHGIPVVQSRRLHDRQEDGFRLGAYERSLETMTEIVRRYPSVKIMIDLHRDAPTRDKTTAVIGGVSTATICVIVGTDNLLDNPRWKANYNFARRLVATMEQKYPGLSRGILVRDERYNQHVIDRTLLLEVGGQENTLEEELAAVRDLGEVLAQILAEGLD